MKKIFVLLLATLSLSFAIYASSLTVPFFQQGNVILTGITQTSFLNRVLFFSFSAGPSDSGNISSSAETVSSFGKDKIIIRWEVFTQSPVTSQIGITLVDLTQLSNAGFSPSSDYTTWPNGLGNLTCNIEAGNSSCIAPGFNNANAPFAVTIGASDQLQVRVTANQASINAPSIIWRAFAE